MRRYAAVTDQTLRAGRREARVERHRRAVVTQVMEVKILQPCATGDFTEYAADMDAAVRGAVWTREHPLLFMSLELALEDLPSVLAQDHRPRAGLRTRQQHNTLLEVDHVAPQESDFAETHEGKGSELGHLPER